MRITINDKVYIPALCCGCDKMYGVAEQDSPAVKIYCNECAIEGNTGLKKYIDTHNQKE